MEPPSTDRSRNASRSDTSHKHWTFGPANAQSSQILPCLTEKPHPVSPHDPFDSCFAVAALAQQVGRLSETIGFTLEDLAREVTPPYLAQHHGIHVRQFDRRFFSVDGDEVEVDLYGEGQQDGRSIVVVGEVRSRIHGRDVESAVRQAGRLRSQLSGAPVVVLFGFVIHPSARAAAHRLEAIVISSSGRLEP